MPPLATIGAALPILQRLPAAFRNSYVNRLISNILSSSGFGALKYVKKFGIDSYSGLNSLLQGLKINKTELGIQVHHLIEKRFLEQMKVILGNNTSSWSSVVLTRAEHQAFTNAWRQRIGYGTTPGTTGFHTGNATPELIREVARDIYRNYPEILRILGL